MKSLREILDIFGGKSLKDAKEITAKLPGKDCGICGFKTCEEFAVLVVEKPDELGRCIFIGKGGAPPNAGIGSDAKKGEWLDLLGREYDFMLERHPKDPGPKETIHIFNPANLEKLNIKKGDILIGRPSTAGCPVSHCGIVVEEPDYFNGVIDWCIVGPMEGRERGINIGFYTPIAYEGIVEKSRVKLKYGMRYFFLPRYCMLQSRHSGVLNLLVNTEAGLYARLEGILLS